MKPNRLSLVRGICRLSNGTRFLRAWWSVLTLTVMCHFDTEPLRGDSEPTLTLTPTVVNLCGCNDKAVINISIQGLTAESGGPSLGVCEVTNVSIRTSGNQWTQDWMYTADFNGNPAWRDMLGGYNPDSYIIGIDPFYSSPTAIEVQTASPTTDGTEQVYVVYIAGWEDGSGRHCVTNVQMATVITRVNCPTRPTPWTKAEASPGTGCSTCGGNGSSPNTLGAGNPENVQGPVIAVSLGMIAGQNAGYLELNSRTAGASLTSPAALTVPLPISIGNLTVTTVYDGSGAISQVAAPQGLITVVSVTNGYMLEVFSNYVGPSGGPYTNIGGSYDIWTITNSGTNVNILGVTESLTGHQFTYTYTNLSAQMGTNYGWQMTDANNIRTVLSWNQQAAVNGIAATNFIQETLSGSAVVQKTQKIMGTPSGCSFPLLLQQIEGNGTTNTTTTYFYTGRLLEEVTNSNGSWTAYAYDSSGNVVEVYEPYGNAPAPAVGVAPSAPYKATCYTYAYDYTYAPDDVASIQPSLARLETEVINTGSGEQEVSRLYRSAPTPTEVEVWRCPLPEANLGDPGNLRTATVTASDTADLNIAGQPLWEVRPDGTATVYSYLEDSNGIMTNVIVQTGAADNTNAPNYIYSGILTSNVLNSIGNLTVSTTLNVSNTSGTSCVVGPVLAKTTYTYTDVLKQNYISVDLAGRTNVVDYACCGLESTTDPDEVVTQYNYDTVGRLTGTTVMRGAGSISTINVLDGAGRILISELQGSSSGTITNQATAYDVLGRPVYTTNALGGVTTNVYAFPVVASGAVVQSNITLYPDGGTATSVHYSDGHLASISGTAVAPVSYQYGAETLADGNLYEYTLAVKVTANGTNEWNKTYTDGVGRSFNTVYAAASGTPSLTSYFNQYGQLTNQVDPDGVGTLYGYDEQGRRILAAVDMNQNGGIDFGGPDRITLTTNDVVTDNGTTVNRIQVFVWTNNGSGSNLVSTREASANGLTNWSIAWNNNGAQGVTNKSVTAYSNGTNRTITSTAPDGSYSASVYQCGQLISSTRHDANNNQIGGTSYGYDQFGRQSMVTDARTGTTTNWFNNMGAVSGTSTPVPASGQSAEVTTNYFDLMGRLARTTLPDGTSVTNVYYPTGLTATNCGSRTYPVAYRYDAQGRMTTMTTWTNFAAGRGAATTAWNYDPYRGFLSSKVYTNGSGPSYTYTSAGRLAGRTWARGTNTTYLHDASGNLTNTAYSDGTASVALGYDRRGRLTCITNGAMVTTLTLNDAGEVLSETNSGGLMDGISITNGFDALLRRISVTVRTNLTVLARYTNNYDAASRLLTVTDGTNSAAYSYLANSPLVGQIVFANNGTTQMTATKTYDNLNRLTGIVNGNGTIPPVDRRNYAYNSANQRTGMTNVDGSYWVYTYDGLGQVTSGIKYWSDGTLVAGQQFDYTFDTIGNRTSTQAGGDTNGLNLRTASYTNNALNQITSRDVPGYADVMGLTLASNTVSVNGTNAYQRYEYFREQLATNNTSAAQWMGINVTAPGQTTVSGHQFLAKTPETFAYDADGNLTNDGHWSYYWDAENRLVAMTNNASLPAAVEFALSFAYDYKGRRVQKLVSAYSGTAYTNAYASRFVYDGWNVTAILNTNASLISTFMWGTDLSGSMQGAGGVGGLLAENLVSNGVQFVAFDANGNVAALVNASAGTVSANYEYGPFGEVIRATGPMAKVNPFRFSTKYQDDETGLLYYGYRYYNPSTGRWLARDPLSEVAFFVAYTQNKNEDIVDKLATRALGPAFCFLENNPTTRYDVLGLQADDDYQVVGPGILVGDDWLNEIFHHIGLADSAELIFYVTCPCGTVPASYGLRASPPPNSSTRHPFPSAWTLMDYAVVGQRTWRMGFAVTTTAILTDMTGVNRVRLYVRCSTPKGNIITIDF